MNNRRLDTSPPERRILDALLDVSEAVSIGELSTALGRHPNTVREQLAGLVQRGLVTRERVMSGGRGRPAWRYRATASAKRSGAELAGLVTALATQLNQVSPEPNAGTLAVGERWGAGLAEHGDDVRRTVLTVLDELGFDPAEDTATGDVRLRACPLLDPASGSPVAVCGVHRGVIRGIVRSAGGDPDGVELVAFHEPDECLVTWSRSGAVDAWSGGPA